MSCSPALEDFTRTLGQWTARDLDTPRLIEVVTPEFRRLLAVPGLLDAEARRAGQSSYAQHVLYTDPRGRFTLVSLVWRPGDCTPVHDHQGWGLAGVYQGQELETRYTWVDATGSGSKLRPTHEQVVGAGEVIPLVPPSDIHRVANPGSTPTISIHLYGFDLQQSPTGSSVRRVYGPELLLGQANEDLAPVA